VDPEAINWSYQAVSQRQQEQNEQHSGKFPRCTPSSNPSITSEHLHIPRTLTTRHNGVHERHGSADKRSQNQTPEEEDESDERDSHQIVRCQVRLGTLHETAVPTRREPQRRRAHRCSAAASGCRHQR